MTIPESGADPSQRSSAHPASVAMGARIRAARRAAGWPQKRLAKKLRVTQVAISRFENGQRGVSDVQLAAIAEALEVPVSVLLEDEAAGVQSAFALGRQDVARRISMVLREVGFTPPADGASTHDYLSTGCLHGDMVLPDGRTGHEYCQGDTGAAGAKTPAQCKFCCAPCRCECHRGRP